MIVALLFGGLIALFVIYNSLTSQNAPKKQKEEQKVEKPKKKQGEKQPVVPSKPKEPKVEANQTFMLSCLKGHTKEVNLAICSPDGQFIVTASEDRTFRVIWASDLNAKTPKFVKYNLTDQISAGNFSSNGKEIVFGMSYSREILGYSFTLTEGKLQVKETYKFPTGHKGTIKSVDASPKFIVTCGDDTTVLVHGRNGTLFATVNTSQLRNNMGAMTPNGKLYAVAAWTSDVKVWHLQTNKATQDFEKVVKVLDLGEHRSTVYSVCFSADSTRAATVSKDATLKVWKVDVRFDIGDDAKCLQTIASPVEKKPFTLVALSPNNKVIAATIERSIYFYGMDGKLIQTIDLAHQTAITSITFGTNSQFLLSTASSDTQVKVWTSPL